MLQSARNRPAALSEMRHGEEVIQMRKGLVLVLSLVAVGFVGCGGKANPAAPEREASFSLLAPVNNAKLVIGATQVLRWQCSNCADVYGTAANAYLVSGEDRYLVAKGYLYNELGVSWKVGSVVGSPDVLLPGVYELDVVSAPLATGSNATPGRNATLPKKGTLELLAPPEPVL